MILQVHSVTEHIKTPKARHGHPQHLLHVFLHFFSVSQSTFFDVCQPTFRKRQGNGVVHFPLELRPHHLGKRDMAVAPIENVLCHFLKVFLKTNEEQTSPTSVANPTGYCRQLKKVEDGRSTLKQDVVQGDDRSTDLHLVESSSDVNWTHFDVRRGAAWRLIHARCTNVHSCSQYTTKDILPDYFYIKSFLRRWLTC